MYFITVIPVECLEAPSHLGFSVKNNPYARVITASNVVLQEGWIGDRSPHVAFITKINPVDLPWIGRHAVRRVVKGDSRIIINVAKKVILSLCTTDVLSTTASNVFNKTSRRYFMSAKEIQDATMNGLLESPNSQLRVWMGSRRTCVKDIARHIEISRARLKREVRHGLTVDTLERLEQKTTFVCRV